MFWQSSALTSVLQNAIYDLMLAMHTHQTMLTSTTTDLTLAFADVHNQISSLKSGMHELATAQNETMNGFHAQLEGAQAMAAAFSDSLSNVGTGGIATILDHFWLLTQGSAIVAIVLFIDWLVGKTGARIVAVVSLVMFAANNLQLDVFMDFLRVNGFASILKAVPFLFLAFIVSVLVRLSRKHDTINNSAVNASDSDTTYHDEKTVPV